MVVVPSRRGLEVVIFFVLFVAASTVAYTARKRAEPSRDMNCHPKLWQASAASSYYSLSPPVFVPLDYTSPSSPSPFEGQPPLCPECIKARTRRKARRRPVFYEF